ncbi:hypothetical protein [Propionibacterium sp.]|uniref:hypothetical protein n=1 Tax=Propionibacterium sp. TaxID=1977903 RepID=UPI0039E7375E
MSTPQHSTFRRPGFILAAAVIVAIVILGVLAVILFNRHPAAAPAGAAPSTVTSPPVTEQSPRSADASVCGLSGLVRSGTLTTAPTVDQWQYEGTVAYPTNKKYGPGRTDEQGIRTCFQHSPTGALYMAANTVAAASDPDRSKVAAWAPEAISSGTYRDQLLSGVGSTTSTSDESVRYHIVGFHVLTYSMSAATVDIALQVSGSGKTFDASAVYYLVWQDGDWKANADMQSPFSFSTIADLSGYVMWGSNG